MSKERTAVKDGQLIPLMELYDEFYIATNEESRFEVHESGSNSVVDNHIILARCIGPSFAIDNVSRNKRFYSRGLWENVLRKVEEKIRSNLMYGSIGHDQEISDKAVRDGKVSHLVKRLWIDESKRTGFGEYLILGTDSGKNLNVMLRAGIPIAVSTRGFGSFTGKKYMGENDIVDPDTFHLESVDWVTAPGIEGARPQIVESHSPIIIQTQKGIVMAEKELLETLAADKRYATDQLNEAVRTNTQLTSLVESQKSEITLMREKLSAYEELGPVDAIQEVFQGTQDIVETARVGQAEQRTMAERLARYETLGSLDELEQLMEANNNMIDIFETLGSPKSVAQALESAYNTLNVYAKLGKPQQIRQAFKMTESIMKQLNELGTIEEMNQLVGIVEQYCALGSPKEIQEAFAAASVFADGIQKKYSANRAKKLSEKYNIVEEKIVKMLESVSVETLEDFLKENVTETPRKRGTVSVSERYRLGVTPSVSRAQRMNETLTNSRGSRPDNSFSGRAAEKRPVYESSTRENRTSRLMAGFQLKNPVTVENI